MAFRLPQRTTIQDISKLIGILGPKIMGMSLDEARRIDSDLFDDTNIYVCSFLGFVEQQDEIIKLLPPGRGYYKSGPESEKKSILRERLRQIPIYDRTIEYFYHNENLAPTKIDIATYWHDNFKDQLDGMDEESLTNAAIFFIKFLDATELGKYVQAGRGRETHARLDKVKVAEYITSVEATEETIEKYEKEIAKEKEPETDRQTTEIPNLFVQPPGSSLSSSNIRALAKLQLELTEKELDSPGARKLIIDMLDRLERENTVLKAKVESYLEVEKKAAILNAAVKSLSQQNLLKASVNSIGGIILGASFSLTQVTHQIVAATLGLILIAISIALREKKNKEDDSGANEMT